MDEIKKIEVCCGANCMSLGAEENFEKIKENFSKIQVEKCGCLGKCMKGPNILVNDSKIIHYSKPDDIVGRIKQGEGEVFKHFTAEELNDNFLGDID